MKTLHSGLTAALLAAAFILPTLSAAPTEAAPIFVPKVATVQSDVVQVRDGWYRGNRGYRYYRPGYRNYNGWWYPGGAFVAGALIGGAIANSNYYGGGYYGGGYYNNYGGDYYPRYYRPRYYAPAYYPPRGTAYRQGYRDGYRDGVNSRYRYGSCSPRLAEC